MWDLCFVVVWDLCYCVVGYILLCGMGSTCMHLGVVGSTYASLYIIVSVIIIIIIIIGSNEQNKIDDHSVCHACSACF